MNEFRKMVLALWAGLSNGQRVSVVATVAATLALLAVLVHFASKPNLTLLYSGLEPAEAAKIVEYLQSRGIGHDLAEGGTTIRVPDTSVHEVRLALAAQGIPRTADSAGGVGFEILDRPSFGVSDFVQRANYYRALQGELARTIRQMDEVAAARVLIVVPQERLFSRDSRESKASVFLQLQPGYELTTEQVNAIRHLVASGVENLQPARVAVVDSAGRALAESDTPGNLGSLSASQLATVRALEDHLRDKAQSMLDQVLGPGEAVVRVTADMNFDAVSETTERFDPRNTVPRQETTTTESTTSQTQSSAGVAGVAANAGQAPGGNPPLQTSQQTRETVTNQYEVARTVETRQRSVGSVRRVTTAVLVNQRRQAPAGGGEPQPAPRTPAELRALEDLVRAAVGFTQDAVRQDVLQVREVTFTDMFATTTEDTGGGGPGFSLESILPYASQGFLVVLSIVVYLYYRSIVHNSRRAIESREFSELLNRYESLTAQSVASAAVASGARRHLNVDEMQRILRENPGNSAQAIKQWMTRN